MTTPSCRERAACDVPSVNSTTAKAYAFVRNAGLVLHLGEPHLFGFEAGLDPRGVLLAGLIEDVRHVLGLLA